MIIKNNKKIFKIYDGEKLVDRIFKGMTKVYEYLPVGYKECKYIESTGTQYIDTKFTPNYNTRTIFSFQITSLAEKFGLFGSRQSSTNSMYTFQKISNGKWGTSYENQFPNDIKDADLEKHVIDKNKNITYMDNEIINTILETQQYTTSNDMFIFCINDHGTASLFGKFKLYYTKIYNGNELVRDFIPVIDSSDIPCLYDLVSKTTFYNVGTGTFGYELK